MVRYEMAYCVDLKTVRNREMNSNWMHDWPTNMTKYDDTLGICAVNEPQTISSESILIMQYMTWKKILSMNPSIQTMLRQMVLFGIFGWTCCSLFARLMNLERDRWDRMRRIVTVKMHIHAMRTAEYNIDWIFKSSVASEPWGIFTSSLIGTLNQLPIL